MKDITPRRFRCGPTVSSCPAIYESDDEYVIVGVDVSRSYAASAGSQGEAAVRVPRKLIEEAVSDRLRQREDEKMQHVLDANDEEVLRILSERTGLPVEECRKFAVLLAAWETLLEERLDAWVEEDD